LCLIEREVNKMLAILAVVGVIAIAIEIMMIFA
jgi:hypothetical protein